MTGSARRLTIFVVVGMLAASPALPQNAPATSFSALTAKVDAIFERFAAPTSPGCAVSVIRDGRTVYARGYGMANLTLLATIVKRASGQSFTRSAWCTAPIAGFQPLGTAGRTPAIVPISSASRVRGCRSSACATSPRRLPAS
jgi:hypothetical protein